MEHLHFFEYSSSWCFFICPCCGRIAQLFVKVLPAFWYCSYRWCQWLVVYVHFAVFLVCCFILISTFRWLSFHYCYFLPQLGYSLRTDSRSGFVLFAYFVEYFRHFVRCHNCCCSEITLLISNISIFKINRNGFPNSCCKARKNCFLLLC